MNLSLGACSYPSWSFIRVRMQMDQSELKRNLKINKKDNKENSTKTRFTLPYVMGVSEARHQVFHHHGVAKSMKHNMTFKTILVHPKDNCTLQENAAIVYQVLCKDCPCVYIGETAKRYGVREKENNRRQWRSGSTPTQERKTH